jgi:hypothetical protein
MVDNELLSEIGNKTGLIRGLVDYYSICYLAKDVLHPPGYYEAWALYLNPRY